MNRIQLDKKGNRIIVHTDQKLSDAIPGAYRTVNGYWTVPLDLETCKLLRELFGKRLALSTELRRWATGARDRRDYMGRLGQATRARLEVVPKVAPRLYKAMRTREYQLVGTRFIADNPPASAIFDEPGLGKTLIAIAGILEAEVPGPYLVVAPMTAAESVWQREIRRWLPNHHRVITLPNGQGARNALIKYTQYTEDTWMVVHPEIIQTRVWWICAECGERTKWQYKPVPILDCGHPKGKRTKKIDEYRYPRLFEVEWGAIVVDESHDCLIRRTATPTQRRAGLDRLGSNVREDGLRIALSGTPMEGKPHQLWGTLNWLDPEQYSAFGRWAELYWRRGGYTGFQIGEFRPEREQMLWDSLKSIALRRTKMEVAKDLPPKAYVGTPYESEELDVSPIGIWLPMDGSQKRAYDEMLADSATELESGRLETISALAELTRLKQFACSYGDVIEKKLPNGDKDFRFVPQLPSNKYDWLLEFLDELGYPRNPLTKVVIVSQFTRLLELYAQHLEKHFRTKPNRPITSMITGRVKKQDRHSILDRFNQVGNEQIMLLNTKAGGQSITIDSADRMVFISETRVPDNQEQAEDRIHRVSKPRQCMYYYLRSQGTVDVGTALINEERTRDTKRLLDVRRGVEYLRRVIELSK